MIDFKTMSKEETIKCLEAKLVDIQREERIIESAIIKLKYTSSTESVIDSQEIDVVGKPMIPSAPKTSGDVTSVTPDIHSQIESEFGKDYAKTNESEGVKNGK